MSIEDVIKAWKSDEDFSEVDVLASPVGKELSDEELEEVTGGVIPVTCRSYDSIAVGNTVRQIG